MHNVQTYVTGGMIAEWHDVYSVYTHPNAHGMSVYFPMTGSEYNDQNAQHGDYGTTIAFSTIFYGAPDWNLLVRTLLGV